MGDEAWTETVRVLKDPRISTSDQAYGDQDALARDIASELDSLHRTVARIGEVREQVRTLLGRLDEWEGERELTDAEISVRTGGDALVDSLTMVEDSLVQRETYDGQTVLNAPSRINFQYIYLMGAVEGSDDGVTQGSRDVLNDLNARWHPLRRRADSLLTDGVATFNAAVRTAGIPPVGGGGV